MARARSLTEFQSATVLSLQGSYTLSGKAGQRGETRCGDPPSRSIGGLEYGHFAAPGRLPPIRALDADGKQRQNARHRGKFPTRDRRPSFWSPRATRFECDK